MTYPFVAGRTHIVVVWQRLLGRKGPQDLDVAAGVRIGRKDVMIGQNHQLIRIKHRGIGTKLPLEDLDGGWTAHVVRHQHIYIDPNIFARLRDLPARMLRQDLFRDRLSHN